MLSPTTSTSCTSAEPSAPSSRSARLSRSTALRWPSVIGSRILAPSTYSRAGSMACGPRTAFSQSFWNARPPRYCASSICRCECNRPSGSLRIERKTTIFSPGSRAKGSSTSTSATSTLRGRSCDRRSWSFANRCDLLRLVRAMLSPMQNEENCLAPSGGFHQPQRHRTCRALRRGAVVARQMKMRPAVAGAQKPWMAAEQDDVAVLVAAIGVAAITGFEVDQRHQPRTEADTAELDRLGPLAHWRRFQGFGLAAFAEFLRALFRRFWRFAARQLRRAVVRPARGTKPHTLAAANRGVAAVAGAEFRINRIRDLRI